MSGKLILTVGLPGSGKSTWAEEQAESNPNSVVRVNRDDIRERLFGAEYHSGAPRKEAEKKVTEERNRAVVAGLKAGKTVIADDTNLNPNFISQSERLAHSAGATFEQKLFDVPVEECLRRNRARAEAGGRFVPENVIKNMAARAYKNGHIMRHFKEENGKWAMKPESKENSPSATSSSQRFHLSPDGEPRPCNAKVRCRYTEGNIEPPHFSTKEEARAAFESEMSEAKLGVVGVTINSNPSLSSVLDPESFQKFVDRGLITERAHPDDPNLRVYSYSREVQYSGLWTPETLLARGLILDVSEGMENATIRSRALGKFFTVEQISEGDWTRLKIVDDDENVTISEGEEIAFDEPAIVSEKLNGALGVLYQAPSGKFQISTKGSFSSIEAEAGNRVLSQLSSDELEKVLKNYEGKTPLFEVITPERPHPVDYGDKEFMVFLGVVDNSSGAWSPAQPDEALSNLFQTAEVKKAKTLREALETPYTPNTEGFVVTVGEGDSQKLYKVKPPEYHELRNLFYNATDPRKMKRVVEDLSYAEAVEAVRDPSSLKLVEGELSERLETVVNRGRNTVVSIIKPAVLQVDQVEAEARSIFEEVGGNRKQFALAVKDREDKALFFAALNGRERIFEAVKKNFLKRKEL